MEQHPIPQNIRSYQFRLVGDMTLKQFFQLAGGVLVGLIFYSTPLPGLIKWPFIIVSVILGAAMAFVPLEERPLEQWIISFFHTIYSPTIFNWKKTIQETKFFQDESTESNLEASSSQAQDAALKNYSAGLKPTGPLAKLEMAEQGFLAALGGIFSNIKGQATPAAQTGTPAPSQPKKIEIPISIPVKVTPMQTTHLVVEEKNKPISQTAQVLTQQVHPTIAGEEIVSTKEAIFSVDAAPPNPPTNPNVVVGQVVDQGRHIVEGVIIEIRDEYGRPIRALRSNKLGHFMAVTPLDPGKYDIICEKESYQFMPVNFEAKGEIIPPILVEGKKLTISQTPEVINQTQTYAN